MKLVRLFLIVSSFAFTGAVLPGPSAVSSSPLGSPVPQHSFFGMNLYNTGLERSDRERATVLAAAEDLGVRWSREEISWANLEPEEKGTFNWGAYDANINQLVRRGIAIVGTLQTTPSWASGVAKGSVPDWYWYAPRNAQDFADFAFEAAQHYAGKISVWEIWNEPDVEITFKCKGCNRPALYAQMLSASYSAIKRANPSATVLIGGLSIHDYNNGGMAFLDQVVAASGGKLNFDVLSIHPYMPDRAPENTDPKTVVQNFPYRLEMSLKWLTAHGAPNKEIWITENGYSTCTQCGTLGVSEEEQARRLVRLHLIAMAAPNVTHFDYFQLKDKFNSPSNDLWGNMAIMRSDYSKKPAYVAYKAMLSQLEGASFLGNGQLMRAVPNRWQAQFDIYHYTFKRDGATLHALWKYGPPETVRLPVLQRNVRARGSRGQALGVTVTDGNAVLQLTEDPIYVLEEDAAASPGLDPSIDPNSPTGYRPSARFASYWHSRGDLALFGYALAGERIETSRTDGKSYVVQWFERARLEFHPEYSGTNNEILLGLLGSQLVAGRTFAVLAPPSGTDAVCFNETGHCVWGAFLALWRKLGIATVGLPLSDRFEERGTDRKTYTVQYFERERLEYHPENRPPYDVLLGLLGRQLFKP